MNEFWLGALAAYASLIAALVLSLWIAYVGQTVREGCIGLTKRHVLCRNDYLTDERRTHLERAVAKYGTRYRPVGANWTLVSVGPKDGAWRRDERSGA